MSIEIKWPSISMDTAINCLEERMEAVNFRGESYEHLRELRDALAEERDAAVAIQRGTSNKASGKSADQGAFITMRWTELRAPDLRILGHLVDPLQVRSASPSLLEVRPKKAVRMDGRKRSDLPKPTRTACKRMLGFLEGEREKLEIFERVGEGFRAKPKPGLKNLSIEGGHHCTASGD